MSNKPFQFNKFQIFSNEDSSKSVDVRAGNPVIEYRESVFVPYVTISVALVDSGHGVPDGENTVSLLEGIKCQGTEKVLFNIEDNKGNKLKLDHNDDLRISGVKSVHQSSTGQAMVVNIVSKEVFDNTLLDTRCTDRYEGQISSVVKDIIEDNLGSDKISHWNIDDTINVIRRWGNSMDPFKLISILMKIGVPNVPDATGSMAGYLFWMIGETYSRNPLLRNEGGFCFRSLDKMFDKSGKIIRKYILNDRSDSVIPHGFTDKILFYSMHRNSDALRQMSEGTWNGTITAIDPLQNKVEATENVDQDNDRIRGGNGPIVLNRDYRDKPTASVTEERLKGATFSANADAKEQVKDWTDVEAWSIKDVTVQSMQNYRQKFNVSVEVKIPADLSLHAGDLVEIQIPELSDKKTKVRSPKDSGIYMIADLCHYGSLTQSYTGLHLVRDSYGVKTE